ncbi:hypothetical protein VPNG_07794 [Cytospora leucostoma]|uniref:Inheritance of peroxisomes protein 1 n=1 Tax=Cytospora leucostoma TaxID=1230097 RepID=A0A423WEN1_9PEZI|nr:hypothetical protein VPNG_07794 [Cytospora leucostoma]
MDHLRPPGDAMPFPAPRRHSTVPMPFQPTPARTTPESVANGSLETLYNHPSVKIVAFTTAKSGSDRLGPAVEDKPGTLPSSSQLERTIAVGAFQIYRAPGSVAFLRCGPALQPILPKSQCWCLDEKSSKFALQIRRPNYWRIEVPSADDEDIRRALLLREILDKIMQFEKTPCPFERTFTVELPERPKTPVVIKKRPWTPPVRNWPPVQPVTPPPEFAARRRSYTSSIVRRYSDFGLDTSNMSLTPATPETKPEAEGKVEDKTEGSSEAKQSGTPTRPRDRRVSEMVSSPLAEEPESAMPLTAIPPEVAEDTKKETLPQITATTTPTAEDPDEPKAFAGAPSPTTAQAMEKGLGPATEESSPVSPGSNRPEMFHEQSVEVALPAVTQPNGYRVDIQETGPETMAFTETAEKQTPLEAENVSPENEKVEDPETREGNAFEGSGELRVRRTRLSAFASRRPATAPSLKLQTSSSATNGVVEDAPEQLVPGSPADSSDSFHSTESWHSPIAPPSPPMSPSRTYPFPHENIPLARAYNEEQSSEYMDTPTVALWERNSTAAIAGSGQGTPITPVANMGKELETSEETPKPSKETTPAIPVTPKTNPRKETSTIPITPKTNSVATSAIPITPKTNLEEHATDSIADSDSLSASWSSAASRAPSLGSNLQHASTTNVAISHSTPRSLSPLPPPANLFTPRRALRRLPSTAELQNHASTAVRTIRRIPSALLNKTCEMLFSPPAHLINLMLNVAARIAAGEWRGFVFGMGEGGEVVDVRWDWSDEHSDLGDGAALEGWGETDFDFAGPRGRKAGKRLSRASFTAVDLSRPAIPRARVAEYQDPWASSSEDQELERGQPRWAGDDGRRCSWGVD